MTGVIMLYDETLKNVVTKLSRIMCIGQEHKYDEYFINIDIQTTKDTFSCLFRFGENSLCFNVAAL